MLNEIYPSSDENFTVLGSYPYNLPGQLRKLFSSNHLDFYVLVKLSTGDFVSAGFRTKEFAELGIANLYPGTLSWLVYPVAEAKLAPGTIQTAGALQS